MVKYHLESLLDAELLQGMRKRPGMYLDGNAWLGICSYFSFILKALLRNSSKPLTVEWTVKEDESISIHIKGEDLFRLKETLYRFTQIELVDGFERFPYYLLRLIMLRIEMIFICEGEQLRIKKEQGTLIYDYECSEEKDKCIMNFVPDKEVLRGPLFLYQPMMEYFKIYAYQYPNLTMIIKDDRELKQLNTYHFPNGLQDRMDYLLYMNRKGTHHLWEARHECIVCECHLKLYICISEHVYLHPSQQVIYAEDDITLSDDHILKDAVIEAMKLSMEDFSEQNHMNLVFKERQLYFLTDFVANIYGSKLRFGRWKTNLEMPELKEGLKIHMKQYFDELFLSDDKYKEIIENIGFKKENTLFLDAVFADN